MVEGNGKALGIASILFQALDPSSPPEPPPPSDIHPEAINSSAILVTWKRPRVTLAINYYTVKYHKQLDNQNINYIVRSVYDFKIVSPDYLPNFSYGSSMYPLQNSVK